MRHYPLDQGCITEKPQDSERRQGLIPILSVYRRLDWKDNRFSTAGDLDCVLCLSAAVVLLLYNSLIAQHTTSELRPKS